MIKTKKGINTALILVTTQSHKTFWTIEILLFKNNDKKNVHECFYLSCPLHVNIATKT